MKYLVLFLSLSIAHTTFALERTVEECSLEQMVPHLKDSIKLKIQDVMELKEINYDESSITIKPQDNNRFEISFMTEKGSLIKVTEKTPMNYGVGKSPQFYHHDLISRDNEGIPLEHTCSASLHPLRGGTKDISINFVNISQDNYVIHSYKIDSERAEDRNDFAIKALVD